MLATIVALLATSSPARAASPAKQAIDGLNAQREANGIPGGIVEVPEWSRQCELHMRYVRTNGTLVHIEDPSKPGYTEAGALGGESSVLVLGGDGWDGGANPWENAPIHLAQPLTPALAGRLIASNRCCSWCWWLVAGASPVRFLSSMEVLRSGMTMVSAPRS